MGRVFKNPMDRTSFPSKKKKKGPQNFIKVFSSVPRNAGCWPYVIREILQNYLTFASSLIPPAKKNCNLMTPGKKKKKKNITDLQFSVLIINLSFTKEDKETPILHEQ